MMNVLTHFLGGLGLFLLGMWLMTDGLKLAAGPALERILAEWTRTRARGLLSGILVTGLVQSSSAVTVATIGFVNAGLLTLGQALWVIFGSNVGTTMTGWLVALVGFKISIEAFALPLIGLGMLLRLSGENTRRAAVGTAIAGFGALFVGIDVLREAFGDMGTRINLGDWIGDGMSGVVAAVLVGIMLTTLMQSSSAAMTVVLTAAAGGVVPLSMAAAGVIGLNLGTTVTAIIAALGATANARRTAAAHVVFNLVTAVAALILLPVLLALVAWMTDVLALDPSAATTLAAFHTTFNLFGVLLMWPLSMRLERLLLARFRTADEDEGRPRHLDANALTVPALALDALVLETRRVGAIARRMVLMALDGATPAALTRQQAVFDRLTRTVAGFVVNIHRNVMSASSGERLSRVLRELRYYDTIARMAGPIAAGLDGPQFSGSVRQHHERFRAGVRAWIDVALPGDEHQVLPAVAALPDSLMIDYALLKDAILRAAAMEELDIERMDAALEGARAMRQAAEQAFKALSLLHRIESSGGSAGIDEARKDLLSE
ncbi:MAG: Na/Pi cotransporter family protein [Methyloversatilis sp.]|jgi:phosphate:Na+ symporter|nr:Na/Pi cotransporter family protein [Methyloversatilis sp.]MBP6194008.1 Na/Pi cotransporter family protein [Methyloversatilis sp.]MBP9118199.1 Na/Pi cotransporter family protein [Methyloversatilis sp.]